MTEARDPDTIQEDIRETRDALADTVEALEHKTDVKGRAEERIADTKERIGSAADDMASKAQQAVPPPAWDGAMRVRDEVRRRPAVAIGIAVVLLGLLLLRRRGDDES
jgi:ElaB/YqjD/DUF883 family membrane-anchored ribosome-binding protein